MQDRGLFLFLIFSIAWRSSDKSVQIMPLGWKEAPPRGGWKRVHLFYTEQKAIGNY